MGNYSKLIGGLVGVLVGYGLAAAAIRFPGIATCTDASVPETCSAFGMSAATLTGFLTGLIGLIGVHQAPANVPSAETLIKTTAALPEVKKVVVEEKVDAASLSAPDAKVTKS